MTTLDDALAAVMKARLAMRAAGWRGLGASGAMDRGGDPSE